MAGTGTLYRLDVSDFNAIRVSYPVRSLGNHMNDLSILASVSCQLHHFWQAHSCPVFFAYLADNFQACSPTRYHICNIPILPSVLMVRTFHVASWIADLSFTLWLRPGTTVLFLPVGCSDGINLLECI